MKSVLSVLLYLLLVSPIAFGIPRFSLKSGESCSNCHFNPTGGGLRNESGWSKGKNGLRMFKPEESDTMEISPRIGKNIFFGFDARSQYLATLRDTLGSMSGFQNMTGTMYLGIQTSEKVDLFAKYDFVNKAFEGYAIARVLPHGGYVKVGEFSPNFGLNLDDHTAYTRDGDRGRLGARAYKGMGFPYNYSEDGLELGYNINENLFVTAGAGTDANNGAPNWVFGDPNYTVSAQYLNSINDEVNYLVGASYQNLKNYSTGNQEKANKLAGFIGLGYKDFSLLAEYDQGKGITNGLGPDTTSTAMMVELSYRITRGLEAMVRYDGFQFSKDNSDATNNKYSHFIIGMNWYPYSFLDIMPQYRIYSETPSVANNAFLVQFHIWY